MYTLTHQQIIYIYIYIYIYILYIYTLKLNVCACTSASACVCACLYVCTYMFICIYIYIYILYIYIYILNFNACSCVRVRARSRARVCVCVCVCVASSRQTESDILMRTELNVLLSPQTHLSAPSPVPDPLILIVLFLSSYHPSSSQNVFLSSIVPAIFFIFPPLTSQSIFAPIQRQRLEHPPFFSFFFFLIGVTKESTTWINPFLFFVFVSWKFKYYYFKYLSLL